MKIEGVGRVRMKLHNGVVKTLANVKFVPSARANIISLENWLHVATNMLEPLSHYGLGLNLTPIHTASFLFSLKFLPLTRRRAAVIRPAAVLHRACIVVPPPSPLCHSPLVPSPFTSVHRDRGSRRRADPHLGVSVTLRPQSLNGEGTSGEWWRDDDAGAVKNGKWVIWCVFRLFLLFFLLDDLWNIQTGIKVYLTDEKELIIEPSVKWAGNPNITIAVKAFGLRATVQVVDLQVFASPRITLKPLVPSFPCFANIFVSPMEKLHVDFGLKLLGADAMSIPGLYRFVQDDFDLRTTRLLQINITFSSCTKT
ncbi:uncharacterized protein [Euphorbia lathyris]|uniref:uncharacterized protein n=1 Tax=Euphorbia lathyris TaxID=212925 RepID=UPI0033142472